MYLSEILLRRPYDVPTVEDLLCPAKGDVSALLTRYIHRCSFLDLRWHKSPFMVRQGTKWLVPASCHLQCCCNSIASQELLQWFPTQSPFRWINSSFLKSFIVQKCSAFWNDFLNSLTKVKRTLDVTQAAVSKNSLFFMNWCCLYNVVVTVPPGFAPQYCLCMLLLFVMPYLITTGCSSLSYIYISSSFALKIMLVSNKLKIYFWGNRVF